MMLFFPLPQDARRTADRSQKVKGAYDGQLSTTPPGNHLGIPLSGAPARASVNPGASSDRQGCSTRSGRAGAMADRETPASDGWLKQLRVKHLASDGWLKQLRVKRLASDSWLEAALREA